MNFTEHEIQHDAINLDEHIKKLVRDYSPPSSGGGGGGASAFTDLNDTPDDYVGNELKSVRVNATANGLEFTTSVGTDEKVKVDTEATAGYLGIGASDGVLRTDLTLDNTDGGNYRTIGLNATLKTNYDTGYTHSQIVVGNPHNVTLVDVGGTTDHTALSNIGINTHGQIDTHILSTSNPHLVTKSQVGLDNVTNDSQVKRSEMGVANGVATLGADTKVPTSQLPALAITEVFVVASEAEQLALTAEEGDVAVRTDQNKSYIHDGGSAGTMADWQELLTPTDTVLSVNGQTGAVVLTTTNINEGINLYYTNTRARASISETITGLNYNSATGVFSLTAEYVIPTTTEETNWNTAYGWGDHSSGGYLKADGSVDLSNDWTIATNSITLTAGTLAADTISDGTLSHNSGVFNQGFRVGVEDTGGPTFITISGTETGSDIGGALRLDMSEDNDGTDEYWEIGAYTTSLTFNLPTTGIAAELSPAGDLNLDSLTIGANTLNTNEWAFLDGQNQRVVTTSTPTFNGLSLTGNISFTATANRTISVAQDDDSDGFNLNIQAGNAFGTGDTVGGSLYLTSGYGGDGVDAERGEIIFNTLDMSGTGDDDLFFMAGITEDDHGVNFEIWGGEAETEGAGDHNGGDVCVLGGPGANAGAEGVLYLGYSKDDTSSVGTVNFHNEYTMPTSDGSAGNVMTTDGSDTVSFASIETLATGLTQGSVVFAGASGVLSEDNSNLFWDNTNKSLGIGTSASLSTYTLNVDGYMSVKRFVAQGSVVATGDTSVCTITTNLSNSGTAHNQYGFKIAPNFNEFSSGNHTLLAGTYMDTPTVVGGGATVTNTATCYIKDAMSATVSGNNYALWVRAGLIGFGNETNRLAINEGVVTLEGTAKRHLTLRPEINMDEIRKVLKPDLVNIGVFYGYSMPIYAADNEEIFFKENVPGRWDGASDITVHILCCLALAETAGEKFKFQLSWNQSSETDIVPATTHDTTDEITVVDGTQYATYEMEFTIDYNVDVGDPIASHDLLGMRLRRVASTGDEVDGEIIVIDWHTKYQVNKMFKE